MKKLPKYNGPTCKLISLTNIFEVGGAKYIIAKFITQKELNRMKKLKIYKDKKSCNSKMKQMAAVGERFSEK